MHVRSIVLVMIAACGYPSLDSTRGGPDGGNGCRGPASYAGVTVSNQSGDYYPSTSMESGEVDYRGALDARDVLAFWLFDGAPPFSGSFHTGMFDLSGQSDLATCGTCVLIAADCNNCDLSSGQGVGSWYVANAGTLSLTAFTQNNIGGMLANATLVHVNIDFTNGTTTAAGDGCTTHVTSVSVSAALSQH